MKGRLQTDIPHGSTYATGTIGTNRQALPTTAPILMVQVMETWFLADRDALRGFFGPQLNENNFREWPDLEEVPKDTVLNALERATLNCQKPYSKGRVSFELLGRIDPQRVAADCPHAGRLLNYLRGL